MINAYRAYYYVDAGNRIISQEFEQWAHGGSGCQEIYIVIKAFTAQDAAFQAELQLKTAGMEKDRYYSGIRRVEPVPPVANL